MKMTDPPTNYPVRFRISAGTVPLADAMKKTGVTD